MKYKVNGKYEDEYTREINKSEDYRANNINELNDYVNFLIDHGYTNISIEAQPQWISVEDKLPEDSDIVKCKCTLDYTDSVFEVYGAIDENKDWMLLEINGEDFSDKPNHVIITHWQPLSDDR